MREKLDLEIFRQIHRGVVVNVGAIDRIYRSFRGRLEIKLRDRNELLPVSAAHRTCSGSPARHSGSDS